MASSRENQRAAGICEGKEQKNTKWKLLFLIVAITVQSALVIKCPLFIIRQISHVFQACPNRSMENNGQEYLFTVVVYSGLFIGRWIEALVLHIHIYKFFFHQSTLTPSKYKELCKEGLTKKVKVFIALSSCIMLITTLTTPILGIVLEIKNGQKLNCDGYVYEHHVVYWIFDVIRYLHDVAIRLLMLLSTTVIGVIWSKELEKELLEKGNHDTKEPEDYMEYLKDQHLVSEDHKKRMEIYAQRGGQVERILETFQTWFIIPWVLYFISSSLDTDHILRSWKDGSSDGRYDFSEVTFMVYNFNQLFLLTFAFLCSKKMNTHHCNYVTHSRCQQLEKYKTASRMALACMNKIEKEAHFDFVPRIWGTSIKVKVENPLYIVILLVSLFFTIVEALV